MESVDPLDKWLDPPDDPTHGPCDRCREDYSYDDLSRRGPAGSYSWYCDTCLEIVDLEDFIEHF